MANLIPFGTDPSGRFRQAENGDQLIDRVGNSLSAGKPTPGSYGVEGTPLMTGDRTLIDADDTVQFLDPNGANRTVTLPTLSNSTPFFVFKHVGIDRVITIRAANGTILAQLTAGRGARLYHDGLTNWAPVALDFSGGFTFGAAFMFAGDKAAFSYLQAAGNPIDTGVALESERYHIAPVAMSFTHFAWDVQSASDTVVSINIDEVTQTTVTVTASAQTQALVKLPVPIAVTAGQIISLTHNVDPNDARYTLLCQATAASILRFGTNGAPAVNNFLHVSGSPSEGGAESTATDFRVELMVPTDCSITSLVVGSTDAQINASVFSVFKNGAPAVTTSAISAPIVTGSYRVGIASFSAVTFAAGDTIALRCDTASIAGIYAQLVDTSRPKLTYHFGGTIGTANNYLNCERHAGSGTGGVLDIGERSDIFGTGVPAISWRTNGTLGSDLRLYKNGAESETFTGSNGTTIGWYQSATQFEQGDTISVRGPSSGAPGNSHVCVTFG